MPELTLEIIWAILSIAVGAIAIAAWQFVATMRSTAKENDQWKWVSIFVNAADQMLAEQPGSAKLDWVTTQLATVFPKLDTARMRAMIEAALDVKRGG